MLEIQSLAWSFVLDPLLVREKKPKYFKVGYDFFLIGTLPPPSPPPHLLKVGNEVVMPSLLSFISSLDFKPLFVLIEAK